ncbi:synaptic vesicle glycoprotein 2C [Drosophila pseudoobscura]|uniref:Synaptic vesicle glycoprotein 2C n=1 Tax=Drosophila pseudoobscura pseudoobscura TaxID=46245 RepID=A0A6I8UYW0_DROPS|nr:synaptic vesicle glycoprotein 2C [Drosophila pseudoobscura]
MSQQLAENLPKQLPRRDAKEQSEEEAPAPVPAPPTPGIAADFETAIDAAGFGMFNILLLVAAVPAAMGTVYETSTMSYILPSAECDLKLSLLDKGILNAITYAGMISSAVFWGYFADTKGRRKLLIFGYAADTICVLGGAFSQSVVQLMVFKYFGGFCMSGPFAVLMTYLTELHGRQHRQRIMMIVGIMFSIATLTLPGLAMIILPQNWNINIWSFKMTAWQMFVGVTALPSLLSSMLFPLFPESPKFLMSRGRNQEALEAFQFMYALNTRKPKDSFPFKVLANEVPEQVNKHKTHTEVKLPIESSEAVTAAPVDPELATVAKSGLSAGLSQLRPLFTKPYLGLSLWVYLLNFCVLLGQNTMRLWLPQLFASINEYELQVGGQSGQTSICRILEFSVNRTQSQLMAVKDPNAECTVNVTAATYTNNLIVAAAGLVAYMLAGFLVNLVGVKRIMTVGLFCAACCSIGMYWSSSAASTVAIASLFVTMGSISATSVISASVSLFPTSLRTMIVSLEMMFGRLGSLLGNIFFPALMNLGCVPPFFMISFFMLAGCLMAAFLPLKNKAALK